MKKVLVVIDYQNDFISGALANPAAQPLAKGIEALCEQTLSNNGYILFTRDTHFDDYLQTREGTHLPVPHCIKNTHGWQLADELLPFLTRENVVAVDKPTFGYDKIAQNVLNLCGEEPAEIHICGVVTDICVISNAILLHSAFLNAKCILHQSLCAAVTAQGHQNAIDILKGQGWNIV